MTGRDAGRLADAARRFGELGVDVAALPLDVTDGSAVAPTLDRAWSGGDFDVVVIAVGILVDQRLIEQDPMSARTMLEVNTVGSIHAALEAADHLVHQAHGTLMIMSSVAGQRGRRDNYVYGASKASLDVFAEGIAQRLERHGVDVVTVRPGYVHSKMSAGIPPAPFAVSLEESRDRIMEGYSRRERTIWVPRLLGPVFFLLRILPRRLWTTIALTRASRLSVGDSDGS